MARLPLNRPEHAVPIATGLSDARMLVLKHAEAARVGALTKFYTPSGNAPDEGFDCSGFVIYVFNQAFGANTLPDLTADQLRTGGRFAAVKAPAVAGDLVFFSAAAGGSTASHVGIVIDSARWISAQDSTGVEIVRFANTYWQPRILSYGRFSGLQAPNAIAPASAGAFASPIRSAPRASVARSRA